MWRSVLYGVSAVEAAVLAAMLFLVVIDPESGLSPGMRQAYALGAVVLGMGSAWVAVAWLHPVLAGRRWLRL